MSDCAFTWKPFLTDDTNQELEDVFSLLGDPSDEAESKLLALIGESAERVPMSDELVILEEFPVAMAA